MFGLDFGSGGDAGVRLDSPEGVVKIHISSVFLNPLDHVGLNSLLGGVFLKLVLVVEKLGRLHPSNKL